MKKTIITITLFVLIALGVVLYNNMSGGTFKDVAKETDTAVIVRSFFDKMIPHHQEAVDSSLQVMNDLGITDPKVRIFAANVVDIQSFEISRMQNMYREYLGAEYAQAISLDATGKMADHIMTDMSVLKGDELAKVYAKDMIKHHKAAIVMAEDYIKLIDKIKARDSKTENGLTITNSHPAVDESYQLAQEIIEAQKKEIETLKSWEK